MSLTFIQNECFYLFPYGLGKMSKESKSSWKLYTRLYKLETHFFFKIFKKFLFI